MASSILKRDTIKASLFLYIRYSQTLYRTIIKNKSSSGLTCNIRQKIIYLLTWVLACIYIFQCISRSSPSISQVWNIVASQLFSYILKNIHDCSPFQSIPVTVTPKPSVNTLILVSPILNYTKETWTNDKKKIFSEGIQNGIQFLFWIEKRHRKGVSLSNKWYIILKLCKNQRNGRFDPTHSHIFQMQLHVRIHRIGRFFDTL